MAHDRSLDSLHPVFRNLLTQKLIPSITELGLPLHVFESFRTPFRQADLYASGRVTDGPKRTNAMPWRSFHQYGLAVDFVFKTPDGAWTWSEKDANCVDGWSHFTALCSSVGLRTLSFERPHVEYPWDMKKLTVGDYPPGGDDRWMESMEEQVMKWGRNGRTFNGIAYPGAPPSPGITMRPEVA